MQGACPTFHGHLMDAPFIGLLWSESSKSPQRGSSNQAQGKRRRVIRVFVQPWVPAFGSHRPSPLF